MAETYIVTARDIDRPIAAPEQRRSIWPEVNPSGSSVSDKRSGLIETIMNDVTYVARYHLSEGINLNVGYYGKTVSTALPQVSIETNVMYCLRQFVRSLDTEKGAR